MTTTRTTQETTLTVSEHIDPKGLAHWTVRDGRTIVAAVDIQQVHGMWDTDMLRDAVALALKVPLASVRFAQGHNPAGYRHYVAARFLTVQS